MNHKYRLLTGLTALCVTIMLNTSLAQIVELHEPIEAYVPEWQASLSVSPLVLHMLGSQNDDVFLIGVHVRRGSGRHALRLGVEGSPSDYTLPYDAFRAIGTTDDRIDYLAVGGKTQKMRVSAGYELSRNTNWGRVYVGADGTGYFANETILAKRFLDDPSDEHIDFDGFHGANSKSIQTFGGGLKPIMGFAFDITERFGLISEFKYDMLMTYSKGFRVENDAVIKPQGNMVSFRTLPLLDVRLSYTF